MKKIIEDPEVCFVCEKRLSADSSFLQCPDAFKYMRVIFDLMPKYNSKERCEAAMEIFREGGYVLGGVRREDGTKFSPEIRIISDLAKKLMVHEKLNEAWFHISNRICNECIAKLDQEKPLCPICGASLLKVYGT